MSFHKFVGDLWTWNLAAALSPATSAEAMQLPGEEASAKMSVTKSTPPKFNRWGIKFFDAYHFFDAYPKFNIFAPWKIWLEDDPFPLGWKT